MMLSFHVVSENPADLLMKKAYPIYDKSVKGALSNRLYQEIADKYHMMGRGGGDCRMNNS